ncbi:unnamed protein product [Brassica oleracea]
MGACGSSESRRTDTAKLILPDGTLHEFTSPVKVWQILQKNPTSFVCNSDDMDFDEAVIAVSGSEDLRPGELYFVLPLTWLNHPLRTEQMAALAVKASSALTKSGWSCGDDGGGQGDREFKAEVETISRVHHRHLLSLVGVSPRTGGHPRIIHSDIKSSNILLDNNFHPLVSDFGLAKLALDCNTHITTRVMGTFGYMAPEYASSGKLTEKSDVFSFGVVLLELVTGRKPVDTSQPLGDESLVEWIWHKINILRMELFSFSPMCFCVECFQARPLLSHAVETEEFEALVDPKLGRNYVGAEMFRMIEAAAACIHHSAAKRPRMSQIVRAFDSLAEEDLVNGMRLGQSKVIDSAEQSAEIRLFRRMAFGSQNYSTDFFTHNIYNSRDENF